MQAAQGGSAGSRLTPSVLQAPVTPGLLVRVRIALAGQQVGDFFLWQEVCSSLIVRDLRCPCLGAVGVRALHRSGLFFTADAGLILQRCPQPGDHTGGAPEDHPERDPDSPGPGDPDAWPRRAGVKQPLQRCRALTRRSRGGDSQPAPHQTKSVKPPGFRWDVGIAGLLPNRSFHVAREQGFPSSVPGEPKIPGMCAAHLGGRGSP